MATKAIYEIELYNSKKRVWEHETTASSYSIATKRAKQRGAMYGKKAKITKKQMMVVYNEKQKIVSR